MRYAVKAFEQGAIQSFDGIRIGEIDALITVRIQENERCQFGRLFDESVKVVTALMAVTRVKLSRRFCFEVGNSVLELPFWERALKSEIGLGKSESWR